MQHETALWLEVGAVKTSGMASLFHLCTNSNHLLATSMLNRIQRVNLRLGNITVIIINV